MTESEHVVANKFSIRVEQLDGFEFTVKFDKPQFAEIHMDEPPPLGKDAAPNAARILAAAIGNCLAASLVFCMKKAHAQTSGVRADVDVEIIRNEARRLRVGKVDVTLHTQIPGADPALAGCLDVFEDFCMVTQSVRHGIPVTVHVESATGERLK
ncbi:MAG TPA: OsmC family protein [Polyangiaceae bacterium]|nr:OsmC family protein [Polyangiaceae bacterium]